MEAALAAGREPVRQLECRAESFEYMGAPRGPERELDGRMIPFGEWLPDQPALENAGATEAKNVIADVRGYRPFRNLNALSGALISRCLGAFSATDKNGANYTYAGDAAKLYRLVDTAMTDASKAGGYALSAAGIWEFASWGETVIAVSIDAPVQTITLGGTGFGDLVTSARKPSAHHIAIVREFVVLGNINESIDGAVPHRVWWSAANNAADFQPSNTTEANFQDLAGGGGPVMKVVGGEYGVIVQRRAIVRMSYEGPSVIFRFDEVDRNRGAIAGGAVASLGNTVFFISDDGFYAFDGSASTPIGKGKVDATFLADLDHAYIERMSAAVDPVNSVVVWAYPGSGNSGGAPNRLILYHWPTGRWSRAEIETEFLFRGISTGYSLDGLDSVSASLDALPASLDDPLWKGGALNLAAFTSAHRLGFFTGNPLAATIETGEIQMFEGKRAFLRSVRPYVDGAGAPSVQIGTRDLPGDQVVWSAQTAVNAFGSAEIRSSARFHRVRVNVANGFTHATGIDAEARPEGVR